MATFHRVWTVRAPLRAVFDALAPERTPELHPLVTAVEDLRPDGDGVLFTVVEGVPLGPFTVPNRYTVRWERRGDAELHMEAWSRPAVHLVHTLRFTEAEGEVSVEHDVLVEAPFGLRGFVEKTARDAHDRWVAAVVRYALAAQGGEPAPVAAASDRA